METISDVRDGSTGEIKKGYLTIEAAVLSKGKKMPLPVYKSENGGTKNCVLQLQNLSYEMEN